MMAGLWWLGFVASTAAFIGSLYVGGYHGLSRALGDVAGDDRAFGWALVALGVASAVVFAIFALGCGINAMFGSVRPGNW